MIRLCIIVVRRNCDERNYVFASIEYTCKRQKFQYMYPLRSFKASSPTENKFNLAVECGWLMRVHCGVSFC